MINYDIPQRWQILKLRQILRPFSEKNHPELPLLSVVREKGVIVRNTESKEENHNYIPDDLSGYKRVKVGQFAMNKMKAWQGSYGISKYEGIVSPAYFVFDVIAGMNLDFFNLAIRSKVYVSYFGRASDGIRVGQWDLSMNRMKEIPFFLPPREEQDQIVRFLDWKVSDINKLINIKRKEIQLIEDSKDAVICTTILHGVVHTASEKNTGISWIGSIPSHWKTIKIKWLFNETDEKNTYENGELLTFSKKRGLIPFSVAFDKLPSASDLSNYKMLHIGQLLENRMQAWHGMFICADREGCVSPDYSVFSPSAERPVNVKFFEYVFRSHIWVEQFANASRGIGSGFNRLYTPQFGAIYTLYPPIEEQVQIVEYLNETIEKYNQYISIIEEEIALLDELKTRLISDVVTGKIDVRGIEIPEYEYVDEVAGSDTEDADSEEAIEAQEE